VVNHELEAFSYSVSHDLARAGCGTFRLTWEMLQVHHGNLSSRPSGIEDHHGCERRDDSLLMTCPLFPAWAGLKVSARVPLDELVKETIPQPGDGDQRGRIVWQAPPPPAVLRGCRSHRCRACVYSAVAIRAAPAWYAAADR